MQRNEPNGSIQHPTEATGGADVEVRDRSSASRSTLMGGVWMLILAVLLSWLPILGPLAAGFVGGRMVGEEKRALGVALVPAIVLGVVVWLVLGAFELPVLGAIAGLGALIVVAVQELPLLAGAWFGALSSRAAASPTAQPI